ncbi:MAG: DNA topoisomerase 4 subunit A [Actinobacteria bacterium]|uniref:DNA topoisomerase (ATP-hydrolyzing) n=1 Tax=freshwater metagenome TaxID=449393 RepID=A0A6J6GZS2_9ZZZZ|nr:DNA topoisomerase 4 subunit A [Actinomycetota bacterium]
MSSEINPEERIVDIDLTSEMQDSFLEYSYSVIYARALPDARDGLKPVHRRIIYQMGEMGLRPDKGHVKSARVSGEVMGKLHPHGDGAIYDAMVRMAQPFTLRVPLIDGHGNFGSLDDGPAAARYTETRLAPAALLMNDGLDEDVVDFKPNYDAQLSEPEVLPAAFPNLLVNGSSGIAVGMATNMPPHNMREVIAAARHLLANPAATTEDLMRFVPGPDLPTGGIIVGLDGIKDAYENGRGSFKTRAKVSVESVSPRKLGLVVTELPYLVGPEKVIEKIKDGVNNKKLLGISDVIDLTDRTNGLKLVIELKTGFDPQVVLDLLYRYTPMEDSFGINNVTLVDGRPNTLGLRDLLGVYLAHRVQVTRRRTTNRLGKKKARLHLVEGLLIAIVAIDEVIQVIRSSEEVDEARSRLMQIFELSEIQAEYILELRLRRLTKFSRIELETEKSQLEEEIRALERILSNDSELRDLVSSELADVAEKYGDDRRTLLMDESDVVRSVPASRSTAVSAELADSAATVLLTVTGLMGRVAEMPSVAAKRKKHDVFSHRIDTTTRTDIGAVTSAGRMIRVHVGDIPDAGAALEAGAMVRASEFFGLLASETLVGLIELKDTNELALATAQGTVKRVLADYPAKEHFELIALKDGDQVVSAVLANEAKEYVIVTSDTQVLRFSADTVRSQGRAASGVAGINLADGAKVIAFAAITRPDEAFVVTAANSSAALAGTDAGSIKLSSLAEFPAKGRATGGVRGQKLLRSEDQLYFAAATNQSPAASATDGKPLELPESAKRDASGTPAPAAIRGVGFLLD